MTRKELDRKFGAFKNSEFREHILHRDTNSDLAAFYLLRYRLNDKLISIYRTTTTRDEFADVMMDFFIYLRDGKIGKNKRPYQSLEGLRSIFSFESYVLSIFKKFLADKNQEESQLSEAYQKSQEMHSSYNQETDRRIRALGQMIAYIDQYYPRRDCFIFVRSLLTQLIGKQDLISNDLMAEAMGLSYSNYRQIDSRIHKDIIKAMDEGMDKLPELDGTHVSLANRIDEEFDENFSDIIKQLYEELLLKLDNRNQIQALRLQEEKAERAKRNSEETVSCNVRYSLKDTSDVRYSRKNPNVPPQKTEPLRHLPIEDYVSLSFREYTWRGRTLAALETILRKE